MPYSKHMHEAPSGERCYPSTSLYCTQQKHCVQALPASSTGGHFSAFFDLVEHPDRGLVLIERELPRSAINKNKCSLELQLHLLITPGDVTLLQLLVQYCMEGPDSLPAVQLHTRHYMYVLEVMKHVGPTGLLP